MPVATLALAQQQEQQWTNRLCTPSADSQQGLTVLAAKSDDDCAAQSPQCIPGTQVLNSTPGGGCCDNQPWEQAAKDLLQATPSPQPQQPQEGPGMQRGVGQVQGGQLELPAPSADQHQAEQPAAFRPPVKGCFWHVYIAHKIQAHRQLQEQQEQQHEGLAEASAGVCKRSQQDQQRSVRKHVLPSAAVAVSPSAAPAKRRRVQESGSGAVVSASTRGCPATTRQQQAPALQGLHWQVLQLLSQQAVLAGQAPSHAHMLQVAASAAGWAGPSSEQHSSGVPPLMLQILSSLPPATAAAAAGGNQLLQALNALGDQQLPGPSQQPTRPGSAAALGCSLASLPGLLAAGSRARVLPWAAAAAPRLAAAGGMGQAAIGSTVSQLQPLAGHWAAAAAAPNNSFLGQLQVGSRPGPVPVVTTAPAWAGMAPLGALLGAAGIPPQVRPGGVMV